MNKIVFYSIYACYIFGKKELMAMSTTTGIMTSMSL